MTRLNDEGKRYCYQQELNTKQAHLTTVQTWHTNFKHNENCIVINKVLAHIIPYHFCRVDCATVDEQMF